MVATSFWKREWEFLRKKKTDKASKRFLATLTSSLLLVLPSFTRYKSVFIYSWSQTRVLRASLPPGVVGRWVSQLSMGGLQDGKRMRQWERREVVGVRECVMRGHEGLRRSWDVLALQSSDPTLSVVDSSSLIWSVSAVLLNCSLNPITRRTEGYVGNGPAPLLGEIACLASDRLVASELQILLQG